MDIIQPTLLLLMIARRIDHHTFPIYNV
jgi:hypothetical protein